MAKSLSGFSFLSNVSSSHWTKIMLAHLWQLWRVSESAFQFRSNTGQFLTCDGGDCTVFATADAPSTTETFYIERNGDRVHIKLTSGTYLQVRIILSNSSRTSH